MWRSSCRPDNSPRPRCAVITEVHDASRMHEPAWIRPWTIADDSGCRARRSARAHPRRRRRSRHPRRGARLPAAGTAIEVETAADARGLDRGAGQRGPVDLIVLDVMLPGEDGLAICRRLAASGGPPIIMLSRPWARRPTASSAWSSAPTTTCPSPAIRASCWPASAPCCAGAASRAPQAGELGADCEFAGWRLDLVRRELRSPTGVVVNLSGGEFSLLRAFVERPQRVLTRDQLLDLARGPDSDAFDRAIDVQISRLRAQAGRRRRRQDLIRTIRNEGYMFTAKVQRR